jgi:hypothetical protein
MTDAIVALLSVLVWRSQCANAAAALGLCMIAAGKQRQQAVVSPAHMCHAACLEGGVERVGCHDECRRAAPYWHRAI